MIFCDFVEIHGILDFYEFVEIRRIRAIPEYSTVSTAHHAYEDPDGHGMDGRVDRGGQFWALRGQRGVHSHTLQSPQ